MKVLLLCWRDSGHPEGGGSEVYLERVAEYLASPDGGGHQVTFRTARYPGSAPVEHRRGVTYVRGGGAVGVYPRAWAYMLRRRYDVIVDTQNGVPFFARVFGRGRGGQRAATILLTHHCHREQWPVAGPVLSRIGWFTESRLSPWVHRHTPYVTVSVPSADDLVALGVDRQRIHIIRNGVDGPAAPISIQPVPTGSPVHLVTLSRLVPHKQIEHALHALAVVLPDHPGTVLDVIGDGWWSENLRQCAVDLGVEDHVIFHGHVTQEQKHRLLARADVHLMPSRKEGWGLAVIEAGLHGVPTIGYTGSAGLRDSVVNGVTGLLAGSEGDFTMALERLMDDPHQRRILGDEAQKRARSFSWKATGGSWKELVEKLSSSRR